MAVAAITEICCPMKDQSAGQVRRRQPPHPDVRVEIRTLVDHLGQHLIGRAQPGEPDTDLLREPSSRPAGRARVMDEHVEKVVAATFGVAPPNVDTHWLTPSMARSEGMSQSAVSRIWRPFDLKLHIVQTWKLSTAPRFIDKVRDVVVGQPISLLSSACVHSLRRRIVLMFAPTIANCCRGI